VPILDHAPILLYLSSKLTALKAVGLDLAD
jgi:hypothetical protein